MLSNMIKSMGGIIALILLIAACEGTKQERFNYTLIKSKLNLAESQVAAFDEITSTHTQKARKAYESNKGNREKVKQEVRKVFKDQDQLIKALLDEDQYATYIREIKIEREGREKHNMTLIKEALELDSAQAARYDLANEAFFTLLIDNHDNYHGKPEVYRQYYAQIEVSRQAAFRSLMTTSQYIKYLELAREHKLGKSEAF